MENCTRIQSLVSVVITTKNESKNIATCLESIKNQSWPLIEIIVVDNFSTDQTKEIARQYTDSVYLLGPERSAQRNFGLKKIARGEFGIYIDADMILSPHLIGDCVGELNRLDSVALYVPEIVLGEGYWSAVRRFERGFYNGTPIDGSRFFRLKEFCESGGFDEKIFQSGSGEDWDIDKSLKLIGKISMLSPVTRNVDTFKWPLKNFIENRGVNYSQCFSGIYHNESNFELVKYLQKKKYYGGGFNGYIKKWGATDPDIKKQFGFLYRYFGVYFEDKKWRRLVRRPDLLIGMYFLRVMVGITFLMNRFHK